MGSYRGTAFILKSYLLWTRSLLTYSHLVKWRSLSIRRCQWIHVLFWDALETVLTRNDVASESTAHSVTSNVRSESVLSSIVVVLLLTRGRVPKGWLAHVLALSTASNWSLSLLELLLWFVLSLELLNHLKSLLIAQILVHSSFHLFDLLRHVLVVFLELL